MKSMTGFGKSETETKSGKIVIETRSENHRFLDVKLQIPESVMSIEPELAEYVKKVIHRGKVRITVSIEGRRQSSSTLDLDIARESKKTLEKLKKELNIKEDIRLEHLLAIKEIFPSESGSALNRSQISALKKTLASAIRKLDDSRKIEGGKLEKDLRQRIGKIERLTKKITTKRKEFMKTASDRLKERIEKILEDTQIDEGRLYQETAFLAERSDITEELVRLNAHIGKFRDTLGQSGSVGKELDFLLQEMNRESGTISAKSKDASISHITIEFRSELEKIREQVQNIE